MANSNNQLKAYVRFDGTGRVIAGSLILQRSKPKIGNWQEIDAKECCGPTTTTTSTSTSTSTTTTTTTVASFRYSLMDLTFETAEAACTGWLSGTFTSVYAAESTIGGITTLYTDAALTNTYGGIPLEYYILGVPGVGMDPPTDPHTGTISMLGVFGSNTACVA